MFEAVVEVLLGDRRDTGVVVGAGGGDTTIQIDPKAATGRDS